MKWRKVCCEVRLSVAVFMNIASLRLRMKIKKIPSEIEDDCKVTRDESQVSVRGLLVPKTTSWSEGPPIGARDD